MGESALTGQLGALLCKSIFAHSMVPIGRRPREGIEGPLLRGAGLLLGPLGHRQAARVTTSPELLRLSRLP
eukprot:7817633-Alexandrium_andersonii.AAC.1